jgi:hypothetical protein
MDLVGPINKDFKDYSLPIETVIAMKGERKASRRKLPGDERIDAINDVYQAMLNESGNMDAPDYD